MQPPSAATLLNIWEQGRAQPPVQRALLLLFAACPDEASAVLAGLPIGQRDRRLLQLRELLFGPRLASVADCPRCGERLELGFTVGDITVATDAMPNTEYSIVAGDYTVRFRLPTSLDLLSLTSGDPDPRQQLLQRCIGVITYQETQPAFAATPAAVLDAVVQRMAELDTQADIQLDLTCPACAHKWLATFDILAYLWSELDAWAYRTLQEVHTLAMAYGWREADILALSPWRRQYYLSMVQ